MRDRVWLVFSLMVVIPLAVASCGDDEYQAVCGDGVLDPGEVCDDGNNADGDGCSAVCTIEVAPACGDGVLDPGEVCDDGNNVDGDSCSADCLSDETCGNNVLDTSVGEQCDDGNNADGDGCSAACLIEGCGDGVLDPGEVCDDGNNMGGDGCSANCYVECASDPALDVLDDGSGANGAVGLPDLVMSEIDPGDYIELWNTTGADIALSTASHQLCSPFAYRALSVLAPGVTVPAGGYATVPWPANFTDVDAGGEVILYANGSFGTSTAILDFVCWGTNPHGTRISQAQSVGKWSGACASALVAGALHRLVMTTGTTAASYDVTSAPSPANCVPAVP
jgi:cysteine-rich repeat protein